MTLFNNFFSSSWYCHERVPNTDTKEKKLLNKVIFVFFAHKKYSHSFIKLQLNHWCHMDYFNDVLTTFLGLERGSCMLSMQGQKALFFIKHILICVPKMK